MPAVEGPGEGVEVGGLEFPNRLLLLPEEGADDQDQKDRAQDEKVEIEELVLERGGLDEDSPPIMDHEEGAQIQRDGCCQSVAKIDGTEMDEKREGNEHQQGEIVDPKKDLQEIVEQDGSRRDQSQEQIIGSGVPRVERQQ
jgi:hypothetical protein